MARRSNEAAALPQVNDPPEAAPPVVQLHPSSKDLSKLVTFVVGDYLDSYDPQHYDVILCMSVIKWIHVNRGDTGIRALFHRFYLQLNMNGYLILEPQPWSSYNKKKLSKKGKEMFGSLKLRPQQFPGLLEAEGFELMANTKPEVSFGGFQAREILIFQKVAKKEKQPVSDGEGTGSKVEAMLCEEEGTIARDTVGEIEEKTETCISAPN